MASDLFPSAERDVQWDTKSGLLIDGVHVPVSVSTNLESLGPPLSASRELTLHEGWRHTPVADVQLGQLFEHFKRIQFSDLALAEWTELPEGFTSGPSSAAPDEDSSIITLRVSTPARDWVEPFSLSSLVDDLESTRFFGIHVPDSGSDWLVSFLVTTQEVCVRDAFDWSATTFAKELGRVLSERKTEFSSRTVLREFSFPEQYKTACQQYLLYFGQFLADLGIKGDIALESKGNEFLLRAVPGTSEEALREIRDALVSYCALADSPDAMLSLQRSQEPAAQQLLSQVQFLHSQITAQTAVINAHRMTIQAQQVTIQALSGALSQKAIGPVEEPTGERLFGDTVIVDRLDTGTGVSLDLGEVVRKIKRRFRDDTDR